VVQSVDTGTETSVEAKYLPVDQGSQRKVIEQISEVLPDIGVSVFSEAFIVESVDLGDLTRFMVTSEDSDSIFVPDLEGDE